MNPQTVFCPNLECLARGQVGKGNIGVHSHKEHRYICHVCDKTFAATKGTVFYRLQTDEDAVTTVVALLAHGCPLPAIVAVFHLDERTVADWQRRAGAHCEQVHEHLVQQPRDLGQVQADEIRVKMCQAIFREALPTGQPGRPHLRPWDGILIAQVVKQYAHGHVSDVLRRIAQGTEAQVKTLVQITQGGGVINTAYIERINATFRARLAGLVRRGRCALHQTPTLHAGVYLVGTVYNFCTNHDSLRVLLVVGWAERRHWVLRTPAMAAGITDHCWTVQELLSYHVPPARGVPSKCRGRPSNEF